MKTGAFVISVGDIEEQNKKFRRIQGVCFFTILLPLFLLGTLAWYIPALLICQSVPNNLSTSSFARDITEVAVSTRGDDVIGAVTPAEMSIAVSNKVTAILEFCGAGCSEPYANVSVGLQYSITDVEMAGMVAADTGKPLAYKRNVMLRSAPAVFQCDYLLAYVDVSTYFTGTGDVPPQLSVTAGEGAAVYLSLLSPPAAVSVELESMISQLTLSNMHNPLTASVYGPINITNISSDISILNANECVATGVTSSHVNISSAGRVELYWDPYNSTTGLQSLTLVAIYNSIVTAGSYTVCIPVEVLFGYATTPVRMSMTTQSLTRTIEVNYYYGGTVISQVSTSLLESRCGEFTINIKSATGNSVYLLTPECQMGTMIITCTPRTSTEVADVPSSTDTAKEDVIDLVSLKGKGQISFHIYHLGDSVPSVCMGH